MPALDPLPGSLGRRTQDVHFFGAVRDNLHTLGSAGTMIIWPRSPAGLGMGRSRARTALCAGRLSAGEQSFSRFPGLLQKPGRRHPYEPSSR